MRLPFPTVAAMDGHCHAGGFMLAMAHDIRVFRDGRVTMSMSEINLGLTIPPNMMGPLLAKMTPQALREVCLFGNKINAKDALRLAIVDHLAKEVFLSFYYFRFFNFIIK